MAKKEAKKDNRLISHSLTTEFAGKIDSEKRELGHPPKATCHSYF
jgi:hypothetical protein